MTWTVGLLRQDTAYPNGLRAFDQTDQSLTIDGQPSNNWALDCGMASVAAIVYYLTNVQKFPDTVHDEEWGESYIGPSDYPQLADELANKNGTPCTIYHPSTVQRAAFIIYQYLKANQPVIVLRTGGNGEGHWTVASQMDGGASSNPFDTISRLDPWGGVEVTETWAQWCQTLRRDSRDNNYLLIGIDRQRAITLNKPAI